MENNMTSEKNYSDTINLPNTSFPMKGKSDKEQQILNTWNESGAFDQLRDDAVGRPKFVLHDGPPYANGDIHIGHALNKVLKDITVRSMQMTGHDAILVPGWDCHGLPIEWRIEEKYRNKGKNKDDVPIIEFRRECRAFAEVWLTVQREQFKQIGICADWDGRYATMDYRAEARIASELMKFAANGLLYRGSKPIMWSVAEKTSLAEAEVEYIDHVSDTVFVAFPIKNMAASIVIWTTTPWTLPGNRAVAYSNKVAYGLYKVTEAADGNWAKVGATYLLADNLAESVMVAAKVAKYERLGDAPDLSTMVCSHPLPGYNFDIPVLAGNHVTDDTGTGFVHIAPGHGREDFDLWMSARLQLDGAGIDSTIPYLVDADGFYTNAAPGFDGVRVLDVDGNKGNANERVIKALAEAGNILARGRLKHQYPHSWRSKKPVIFRNTPQWFIAMDKQYSVGDVVIESLREQALANIKTTKWHPESGQNRITSMVANRPDWVVSRQRSWGVPLAIFVHKATGAILVDDAVNARILSTFQAESSDAWYQDGAAERFLAPQYAVDQYEKINDVLDVWFDSGCTNAFVLNDAIQFPLLSDIDRARDEVMYLEGSDQHRGWFQSSLLESCGTRGIAPFVSVLTHGFVLDKNGRKMAKSEGNVIAPKQVIRDHCADVLRLWVAGSDYSDDMRIGPEIMKTFGETYRKMRNTIRWMVGSLAHHDGVSVAYDKMPELEQYMLHMLSELDAPIKEAYANFDYKNVISTLNTFMSNDLSAFYFDIRKDSLYCDPKSSVTRKSALTVISVICDALLKWLAPIMCFTSEEAWLELHPAISVHRTQFRHDLHNWQNVNLASKWKIIRQIRSVVTGALEVARGEKRIGSPLDACPGVFVSDQASFDALVSVDFADVCITSSIGVVKSHVPNGCFTDVNVPGVGVIVNMAQGIKCARSRKVSIFVGSDAEFPDVTPRDAQALRERRLI